MPPQRRIAEAFRRAAAALDFEIRGLPLALVLAAAAAVFATCLALSLRIVASGSDGYRFGDFYALWCSAVLAHDGTAATNYDADALHRSQVALGMHPGGYNPFPYSPTLLLLLAPLGALGLAAAYATWMSATLAAYLWAVAGGRKDWRRLIAALIAPATSVTLLSGQSGFLSGALMLGGLRLAKTRPIVAGLLFGLLAYKPQLALLAPVALIAAGWQRVLWAAAGTAILCAAISSAAFGADVWTAWFDSLASYSERYHPLTALMPTIAANTRLLGAPSPLALVIQACVAAPVAVVVWRAFRRGPSPQAGALLVIGTFLATPHAFNYDMPMTAAVISWMLTERLDTRRSLSVLEAVVFSSALALPIAMLAARQSPLPISWAPLLLLFLLVARSKVAQPSSALDPLSRAPRSDAPKFKLYI